MAKTKAGAKASAPEVLPAEQAQELSVIQTDGTAILSFLSGLVPFFTRALDLEKKATEFLADCKRLKAPTTAEEDAKIQAVIRTGNAAKKTVEEHWTITTIISGVHRKLTGRRAIATGAIETGCGIAQRLHNEWAEKARREAAEAQDRIRREAEEAARQERERELAAAEQRALELEAGSKDLSEREQMFVDYITGPYPDATRAAQQAGYKDAFKQAARLMTIGKIIDAINAKRQAKAVRDQAAAIRQQPLDVEIPTIKPDIIKAGGFDRTTHSAIVVDELALIMAVIAGKHGIPPDVLTVNPTKLNEYARTLQERINLWPGVQHKKTTKTI